MRIAIYNGHTMTHKHVNKNPARPIIKTCPYHKLHTDEGESPHLQDCQKFQYLTHLQDLQRIQDQLNHLTFLLSLTNPHAMKLIHL